MSDEKKDLSRRGFLGAGGAALLSGMVLGALPLEGKESAGAGQLPKQWDETYDVVVVGTGFAGLSAAIEARLAGASVLVIDKMPVHGGNSIINGGDFAAAGNSFQKEAGVQDSPELMLKDMMKAGSYLNHPPLARLVAERSNEALEWCKTYIGAKFTRLNFHGGHSVKRSVQTYNQSGSGLVNPLLDKAKSLGVKVVLRTKMTRLIAGKEGRTVVFKQGMHHFDGKYAMLYVRVRYVDDDFHRAARQQQFVQALEKKLVRPSNITRLPEIGKKFMSGVATDLTTNQILELGFLKWRSTGGKKIVMEGTPGWLGGVSYVFAPPEATKQKIVHQFLTN